MTVREANNLPASQAAKTLLERAGETPLPHLPYLTQLASLRLEPSDNLEEALGLLHSQPEKAAAVLLGDEDPLTAGELLALGPRRAAEALLENLARRVFQPEPTTD